MKIVFGWHLDGPTWPETPDGHPFALDAAVVGPRGLLDLLETRLGLNGPGQAAALRIAQYLSRLRSIDDGAAFFSRSLAADGWATARLLLGWRDDLIAGGWVPGTGSWYSDRINRIALADMEDDEPLAAGTPDRAFSVVSNIRAPSPIDELTLVDCSERLPLVWRRLIDSLASAGTTVARKNQSILGRDCDLAKVQALLADRKSGTLEGDGSFAVARCDDELVAADIAAEWLAASHQANGDVVIVRQGDGTILDAACHRLGLPKPGGSQRSPFRGALQILPLAFETAWQPLDPERMLELLLMRGSPVPHQTGRWFAEVLRDFPGTGGARWRAAWDRAEERLRETLAESDLDEPRRAGKLRDTLANWRSWLEPERYPRETGVSAKAADAICRKVQHWAISRSSANEDAIYIEAANAASALAETIAASGLDLISKPQLDRMIDAVIAEGIARPGTVAEAASWTVVDNPAQIWSQAQSVLWWGFRDSGSAVPMPPWTIAERSELAAAGVALVSPELAAALQLDAHRRAILGATQQVLLVEPVMTAAQSTASHPIWHELAGLDDLGRSVVDGRGLRRGGRAALCGRSWDIDPVAGSSLPEPIRDWLVQGELVGPRKTESASSLESLLGCPLNWVLQYQAHLRQTGLLDMADGNRLKGNVAHEVLARLLADPLPDDPQKVRETAAALLEQMLPEIGSPLLLPGRLREREDLLKNTIESAVILVGVLKSRELSVVATERSFSRALDERSELRGVVDLELASADGRPAIVDLKWSNWDRYRRQEISESRPVQLATYARLLQERSTRSFPPGAYFMIKQRRLLAVNAEPFPPEFRIEGADLADVWDAVVEVRDSTLREMASGRVVAKGVEPDGTVGRDEGEVAEAPIHIDPPCRFCSFGRLCGVSALQ